MLLFRRTLCARATLGVPVGATRAAIRLKYFELAKETHPDTNPDAEPGDFLAVQQAFEELMAAPTAPQRVTTAANKAARGSAAQPPPRRSGSARPAGARPLSLGEILCQRLEEEPTAYRDVWDDIVGRKLEVNANITCAIFKACAASGAGMPAAVLILREAQAQELLTREVRSSTIVSLLTLCKEEGAMESTFEVVDMITDDDRTEEVLAALSSTFSYFPSGASF